ncbi:AEC family transporter [Methylocaldum sp. BRCS4]|jgi:predicted permease|uniref:AEC family transporter n=1 Tax=Methylocaldum sp. GT1TLB TaxID=3438965 RepID=UPI0012EB92DD|nr:AEC family transporter [Methylocaldum sp. BRCS4]
MVSVLMQMAVLILCGAMWRIIRPGGLDADQTRLALTAVVFHLLLPALVLSVLWTADLGMETLKISLFGAGIILFGIAITWLAARLIKLAPQRLGAAMLSIAFSNVTYMGLPVLEQTFGAWARTIVIQIDLFASMPLVFTLGILIARHYGTTNSENGSMLRSLLLNPPLWAAAVALGLNFAGVAQPAWMERFLMGLSAAVVPLMLISLGLGLRWNSWHSRNLPLASVVVAFKMGAMPLFGLGLGLSLGFEGDTLTALVLEAAMPSMLLGVVYCDRYRLDTSFYALAVSLTTLFAMVSLPFWHHRVAAIHSGH